MEIERETSSRISSDVPFLASLWIIGGVYVILILSLLIADASYKTHSHILKYLQSKEIRYAIKLSLISCTMAAILSLWVAIPIGYLMSRYNFHGKIFFDAILDIPIVLPPLVIGLSLLILFQTPIGRAIESKVTITYGIPAVILAQFMVACAFAVRAMRVSFDQLD
ncbi:MAG: molybdenum ABC transporter permease, partial [Candidatus Poribacteria bacterium]|nr:molybdenum ABC transporter permease [Candidatus Poribacteria bacterium]